MRLDMPADTDIDNNTPTQSDKIGWRRGLQQTNFRRLSADQLQQYGVEAKVIHALTDGHGGEGDQDLGYLAAIIEELARRYYRRQIETTSPKGADRRGEAVRIADAARMLLQALNEASDNTLDSLDDLGGEVRGSHRAVTKTLTAVAQLVGPAQAGRPSHHHLDDFAFELVTIINAHYDVDFSVDFADDREPIPPASVFLWMLIKHFVPDVNEGSLRTSMRRANKKLKQVSSLRENPS
jgi:hypothetical protein